MDINNTSLTEIALIFSLNHVIGDGYTLYRVWRMLDKDEKIESMTVERNYKFSRYLKRDTNFTYEKPTRVERIKETFGVPLRGIHRILHRKSFPRQCIYKVNLEGVKAKYVSTNDIINSWFFGKKGCDTDNIFMYA